MIPKEFTHIDHALSHILTNHSTEEHLAHLIGDQLLATQQ